MRSAKLFERRASRINYVSSTILSSNTALVRCQKQLAFLCKPIYLGACVLDLSKLVMIRHFYHGIKPTFDRPGLSLLTLQMTDTGNSKLQSIAPFFRNTILILVSSQIPSSSPWNTKTPIAILSATWPTWPLISTSPTTALNTPSSLITQSALRNCVNSSGTTRAFSDS